MAGDVGTHYPYGAPRKSRNDKRASGVATQCHSRIAKSGSQAHSFSLGDEQYTVFTNDPLSPVADGDHVSFEYEVRRLRSGHRNQYLAVKPDSIEIRVVDGLDGEVAGSVYILSNPSMKGLLKVGFTTGPVSRRAAELSGVSGVPTAFREEWSMPVVGNPRAVEQRAHALLAGRRHGKEFFEVGVEEAREACQRAFAELYPEKAKAMDAGMVQRAAQQIERRAQLATQAEEREREREEAAKQAAYEASPEGRWHKSGSCELLIRAFAREPDRGYPSFFQKLFGVKFDDYLEAHAEPTPDGNGGVAWVIFIWGRAGGSPRQDRLDFVDRDECLNALRAEAWTQGVSNIRSSVVIGNAMTENPPIPMPRSSMDWKRAPITSLDGIVIRAPPVHQRHRRTR